MKKYIYQIPLLLLFIWTWAVPASADGLDFTSYYPSPFGRYSSFRLIPQPEIVPSTNCEPGTFYTNSTDNGLPYFCVLGSPSQYLPFPGVWTLNNNDIYPTDTVSRTVVQLEKERVGIGTINPELKLTLMGDGGILGIDDQMAPYSSLPNLSGSLFFYYPKKQAFRAGLSQSNEWYENKIGNNSIALGFKTEASQDYATVLGGNSNEATGLNTAIGGGASNVVNGNGAYVLGGQLNSSSNNSTVAAGLRNNASGSLAVISGGADNVASAQGATVSGGSENVSSQSFGVVNGGKNNQATNTHSTVAGGLNNSATGARSIVSGGFNNTASGDDSTVSGGRSNSALRNFSTVSGGYRNSVDAAQSIIAGGEQNLIEYNHALSSFAYGTILGGNSNTVSMSFETFGSNSTIIGGSNNMTSGASTLLGGKNMILSHTADRTFLWGYNYTPITPVNTANALLVYAGRVGFRDTNPAAILEINNNGHTDNYLAVTNSLVATPGIKFIITANGRIGVGVTSPSHPFQFANGAYVDSAGRFQPASSRKFKKHITNLDLPQAKATLNKLSPLKYNYKNLKDEVYLGFIAEDVPDLVAEETREGVNAMDITAILTKVIKDQQQVLQASAREYEALMRETLELEKKIRAKRSTHEK